MTLSLDRLWSRAERYLAEQQLAPARATLESIVVHYPNQPRAHLVLGGLAWKQDRIRDSIACALGAARCEINHPDLVRDVIAALIQVGEAAEASRMFDHPLLSRERLDLPLLMGLSGQAQANGEHERALAYLERARGAGAEGADYLSYLGVQLTFNGRMRDAERALETCARLNPAAGRAALILSRLHKQTPQRNHLDNLRAGLARVQLGSEEHAALEFARYKELEDLCRHGEAWTALVNANRIMHGLLPHEPVAESASVERLLEATAAWTPPAVTTHNERPTPVFIVGMPRSGTTLLDRILSNHSEVADAGELSDFGRQLRWAVDHLTPLLPDQEALDRLAGVDFPELGRRYLRQTQWRAGGKAFYVDKLPANWVVSGLIARALPGAPILHMVREPMDVCFSNWRAMFGDSYPYSYDMVALAQHYVAYRRVMAHWHRVFPGRILDIAYRDLVSDPERTARKVFAFCGLAFEPGCIDVTRNEQKIATLSMVQAREPIHARGNDQWRAYAEWLTPLQDALASS